MQLIWEVTDNLWQNVALLCKALTYKCATAVILLLLWETKRLNISSNVNRLADDSHDMKHQAVLFQIYYFISHDIIYLKIDC